MSVKCVVLVSGGIDSTVLLYSLVNRYECYPLTVNYGQRHMKECIAARNICEARDHNLLLRYRYVDLPGLKALLPSALTGVGEVPEGHYAAESMKQTVVPGRNLIFLAVAAGYAEALKAKFVAYAAHAGDHYIYPDCRPGFVDAANIVLSRSSDGMVGLHAPFLDMSKADLVKIGTGLTVPFRLTWSCYEGGDVHCGVCGTCVERREAFQKAGVPDPTKYVAVKLLK